MKSFSNLDKKSICDSSHQRCPEGGQLSLTSFGKKKDNSDKCFPYFDHKYGNKEHVCDNVSSTIPSAVGLLVYQEV